MLLGPGKRTPTDPYGTRYAVMTFLEDSLGCRFLWPGELGKVIPRQKTIEVDPIDVGHTPTIRQRQIRMASGLGERKLQGLKRLGFSGDDYRRISASASETESRDGGWARWHRLGGSLRLASGHSFGDMWEKHKDKHPEWFALQRDGTRDQSDNPDRSRLCVSNMELIEEIARDRIDRMNKRGFKSVSIAPNDGGSARSMFCLCDKCKALDAPDGRKLPNGSPALTDRFVFFWNEITKRVVKVHPDDKREGLTTPYTEEVVEELRGYLDAAAAATKDEADSSKRVAFLRSGLEYTDAYCAAFRIIAEHQASGAERLPKETKVRIRKAFDNNWLVSREMFEKHHLAVNVGTVAWGSWNYFGRFGWNKPSPEARAEAESRDSQRD